MAELLMSIVNFLLNLFDIFRSIWWTKSMTSKPIQTASALLRSPLTNLSLYSLNARNERIKLRIFFRFLTSCANMDTVWSASTILALTILSFMIC